MALYLIGLGLADHTDVSVKGLQIIKKCAKIYLESYTGLMACEKAEFEKLYQRTIDIAGRELVEGETLVDEARDEDVALLVPGDPLAATTHIELMMACRQASVEVRVLHNASVLTAISQTGLQLYKFGKTTSIPLYEENFKPEAFFDILVENQSIGAHTLLLLEIRIPRFVSVNNAIELLLAIAKARKSKAFSPSTVCVACCRLGYSDQLIRAGTASELIKLDFGNAPHCLIVPGKMHFREEEFLKFLI